MNDNKLKSDDTRKKKTYLLALYKEHIFRDSFMIYANMHNLFVHA